MNRAGNMRRCPDCGEIEFRGHREECLARTQFPGRCYRCGNAEHVPNRNPPDVCPIMRIGHWWRNNGQGPQNCHHCGSVGHLAQLCPFVEAGESPRDNERCEICGSFYHKSEHCPRRRAGYCPRCKDTNLFFPEEHGPGRCHARIPRCHRCDSLGHMSALCPQRDTEVNYVCGICASGAHLTRGCPQARDRISPQDVAVQVNRRGRELWEVEPPSPVEPPPPPQGGVAKGQGKGRDRDLVHP